MNDTTLTDVTGRPHSALLLDRVERFYLTLLRGAVLVVATAILVWAAWLAVSSIYRIARSPDSVSEKQVSVAAADLEPAKTSNSELSLNEKSAVVSPEQQKFYQNFVTRYYALYRNKFEAFRRSEDKRLSKDEFDDNFLQSNKRMQDVAGATGAFTRDKADLESLFSTMQAAADLPAVKLRLDQYKRAQRKTVEREVRRTRTETRRGWDSYSSDCENWYVSPIGCAVNRQVSVPYTQKIRSTALPDGVVSHTQTFRSMQDRYFALLGERREQAKSEASAEREAIAAGNVQGWAGLGLLLWVLGGFVVLMFFFVLIAIERHQRSRSLSTVATIEE